MTTEIITSLNQNEFKQLMKSCLEEVLGESKTPNTDCTTNKLLTVSEAAEFMNLATQTLYGYTSKRLIPFVKRGKKLYFQKEELEKWLLEGKKLTKAEIESNVGLNRKGR